MAEFQTGYGSAEAQDDARAGGERFKLWLSWAWVGIPGLWGVYHVVVDALKLFR